MATTVTISSLDREVPQCGDRLSSNIFPNDLQAQTNPSVALGESW
jgi:hypothetical protein